MTDARPCANCGAQLTGAYCSACGQSARASRVSLEAWLFETVGEVFSLEGRTWRTLRDLLRPGRLSLDWAAGRRARHLPPLRTFLLASLVFLSVAFLLGPMSPQAGARAFNEASVQAVTRRTATEVVALAVPALALVLALVYWFKRRYLVEHVVFALHTVSFGLVVLTIAWLIASLVGGTSLVGVTLISAAVLFFGWLAVALHRFYGGPIAATGVVLVVLLAATIGATRPVGWFASRRLAALDRRDETALLRRADAAYEAWASCAGDAEARRAAAVQGYVDLRTLDARSELSQQSAYRLGRLALELGMPAQAQQIADSLAAWAPTDPLTTMLNQEIAARAQPC